MLRSQITIQPVLQQEQQNVFDEIKVSTLLDITIYADGEILADGKNKNVKWR